MASPCNGRFGSLRRRCGAGHNQLALCDRDLPPLSWSEWTHLKVSYLHANEAQRGKADQGRHAADLVVLAFGELERDPAIRDRLSRADRWIARRNVRLRIENPGFARLCLIVPHLHSRNQMSHGFGGRDSFNLRPITSTVTVLGIEQLKGERPFIAEQEQALGFCVQPPHSVHPAREVELF